MAPTMWLEAPESMHVRAVTTEEEPILATRATGEDVVSSENEKKNRNNGDAKLKTLLKNENIGNRSIKCSVRTLPKAKKPVRLHHNKNPALMINENTMEQNNRKPKTKN